MEVCDLIRGPEHHAIAWVDVLQAYNWEEARVVETLWSLLKEGIAMADDQGPGGQRLYWFPCLESSGNVQADMPG